MIRRRAGPTGGAASRTIPPASVPPGDDRRRTNRSPARGRDRLAEPEPDDPAPVGELGRGPRPTPEGGVDLGRADVQPGDGTGRRRPRPPFRPSSRRAGRADDGEQVGRRHDGRVGRERVAPPRGRPVDPGQVERGPAAAASGRDGRAVDLDLADAHRPAARLEAERVAAGQAARHGACR